jgi:hypothetical protein
LTAFDRRFQTTCCRRAASLASLAVPGDDLSSRTGFVGRGAYRVEGGVDDGLELDRREVERELARADARDVQELLDEPCLRDRVPLDRLDRAQRLLGVEPPAPEEARPGPDRGERRAELVREHGEEVVLRRVRPLRGVEELLALRLGVLPERDVREHAERTDRPPLAVSHGARRGEDEISEVRSGGSGSRPAACRSTRRRAEVVLEDELVHAPTDELLDGAAEHLRHAAVREPGATSPSISHTPSLASSTMRR